MLLLGIISFIIISIVVFLSLWTTSKAYDYKHKVDSPQDAEPNQHSNPK
ncbi:ABC transporter ATP-binding protein [Bacillus xiamenensis]|uniref:YtzI protein n=1 Tax=Bacillus xiamenensis TaxID=1178537 RepID=A0ABT4F5D5_9BACI|nr:MULTISPECIES: YtzI protein [Bacillus]MBG9912137.1 ABC transporter ATP-binding protein [Bacillus xiamenensis]MCY9577155.1 YtzI protein [Bacillus xiamenensis]QGX65001.1 YtzI protein [Bacillus sp. ms-22]